MKKLAEDEQFVYRYTPALDKRVDGSGWYASMDQDPEGEFIKYEYHKNVVVAGLLELVHKRDEQIAVYEAHETVFTDCVDTLKDRIKELEAQVESLESNKTWEQVMEEYDR